MHFKRIGISKYKNQVFLLSLHHKYNNNKQILMDRNGYKSSNTYKLLISLQCNENQNTKKEQSKCNNPWL